MRWKIIVVNAGIVLMVALLTYVLLATALGDVVSNPADRKREVAQSLRAANAQLALDALRFERWLASQAVTDPVQGVFSAGTAAARADSATTQANRLRDAAVAEPDFAKMAPALVVFVDKAGVALGRNGSSLMRGDKLAEAYPSLADSLRSGRTASDVWLNRQRQEQYFVSYAPVRASDGAVVGAVVIGSPLNDERLNRTSELTSGVQLVFGVPSATTLEVVANSSSGKAELIEVAGTAAQDTAKAALGSGTVALADAPAAGEYYGAAALSGYGDGKRAVLISGVSTSLVGSLGKLLWPVFAVALLGVMMVIMGGVLLGNYISRPISEIEEGLLAIINGRQDLRFELEHEELGGLVFRLNSLLNVFTGVQEDTTDEEGRQSRSPSNASEFEG